MPQYMSLLPRKSSPRRPQDAPRRSRTAQETPRTPQDAPKTPPKTPPRRPKTCPKRFQDSSKTVLDPNFDILAHGPMGHPLSALDFHPTGPWGTPPPASILDGFLFHFEGSGERVAIKFPTDQFSNKSKNKQFKGQPSGGFAALLRFGSAAPGRRPAHGVQSSIP